MTESTEVKEEIKEEIKPEPIAEIVLECRINDKGGMAWTIPPDVKMASYLLMHLTICVQEMHKSNLERAMAKPKTDIKAAIMAKPSFMQKIGWK
jgi:hypothetical protein